jgi:uncharacterized protein (UPF0297 family)
MQVPSDLGALVHGLHGLSLKGEGYSRSAQIVNFVLSSDPQSRSAYCIHEQGELIDRVLRETFIKTIELNITGCRIMQDKAAKR